MGLIERYTIVCVRDFGFYKAGDQIEGKFSEDAVNFYLYRDDDADKVFPKSKFRVEQD